MSKLDLDKPVQTRAGQAARIICRDVANDPYVLTAMIRHCDNRERPRMYSADGRDNLSSIDSPFDLVNVPEPATEHLFIGGVADGRRIAVPNDTRQYSVLVPGGGIEEYWRTHLSSFTQARYVFVSSKTNGTGALDELIKQYPAAAPAGPVGAFGGDGVVGVNGITSARDIFLVWTYGPYAKNKPVVYGAYAQREQADQAASDFVIRNLGYCAYVTTQSLYE